MARAAEQSITDFHIYPPIGTDDWRYAFATARANSLETQLLTASTFEDMTNASGFDEAMELLAGGEYALPQSEDRFTELQNLLREIRTSVRRLFCDLCVEESIVKLFKSRDDFTNLRLAVRRAVTDRPIGQDYSPDGNVPPQMYEPVFKEEKYELFPGYMQNAVERAVLDYYYNKDIRRIDYAVDSVQAEYNLNEARLLKSPFLLGLFRIQIDLNNIKTMLRVKFTDADQRNVFLEGGYLETERFGKALELDYKAVAPVFYVSPYYNLLQEGAEYLANENSFLKIEQLCDRHLMGFLHTTREIIAGPQPVIAYLLMKESEIRTVRLILTAKRNNLENRLIMDRVA